MEMESFLFVTFIFTAIAVIVMPGPNVLVIISTSISHGTKRGLQTVLGTSSAMIIQLVVAALGTTMFVESISTGFELLRWFGVAYLIYLGMSQLFSLVQKTCDKPQVTGKATFRRGFIVSLTNPKTILFFSAFLPQFVSPNGEYINQIIIFSTTFLILATMLDSLYAILAGRIRGVLQGDRIQKTQKVLSGILYLGAGTWLAAMRRV